MAIMVVGWGEGGVMIIMHCNLYEIDLRRKTGDEKVKEHEDKLWLQAAIRGMPSSIIESVVC